MRKMKEIVWSAIFLIFNFMRPCASTSGHAHSSTSSYPWGGVTREERQKDLLQQIRESLTKDLFVHADIVGSIGNLTMRDVVGKKYSVIVKGENTTEEIPEGKVVSNTPRQYHSRIINKHLAEVCLMYPQEYWHIEWCHHREIRQFHLEAVNGEIVRSPDWSLGKFERSFVIREGEDQTNTSIPITKIIDYYIGGQICHENQKLRSTEVHLQCCSIPPLSQHYYPADSQNQADLSKAGIVTVVEEELCSYKMEICVPKMCPEPKKAEEDSSIPNKLDSLATVFHFLQRTCLQRQESWWTYEVCFNMGVRQFHVAVAAVSDGAGGFVPKQTLQANFSLGSFDVGAIEAALVEEDRELKGSEESVPSSPSLASEPEETHSIDGKVVPNARRKTISGVINKLVQVPTPSPSLMSAQLEVSGFPTAGFTRRQFQPRTLKIESVNGTTCDLGKVPRETTVELFCSDKDELAEVVEDRTCHYYFKVHSTILCKYPMFQAAKQKLAKVTLEPIVEKLIVTE